MVTLIYVTLNYLRTFGFCAELVGIIESVYISLLLISLQYSTQPLSWVDVESKRETNPTKTRSRWVSRRWFICGDTTKAYGDLHLLEIEQMKWTELHCEGLNSVVASHWTVPCGYLIIGRQSSVLNSLSSVYWKLDSPRWSMLKKLCKMECTSNRRQTIIGEQNS